MSDNASDALDQYHASVSKLFDEVTRDPQFNTNTALQAAGLAAQTAVGKVEQRLEVLQSAKTPNEKRVLSDELHRAEAELDAAAIEFLKASVKIANADTAKCALELLNAIPKALSQKHDLSSVRASLDRIVLKHKKPTAGLPRRKR